MPNFDAETLRAVRVAYTCGQFTAGSLCEWIDKQIALADAAAPRPVETEMPEAPACEQHGAMVADDLMGNSWHCAACSAVWPQPESPDKDSYEADGVWYCGRCHQRLSIAAPVGEQEKAAVKHQGQGEPCQCGHHRLYHASIGPCMVVNCQCKEWRKP